MFVLVAMARRVSTDGRQKWQKQEKGGEARRHDCSLGVGEVGRRKVTASEGGSALPFYSPLPLIEPHRNQDVSILIAMREHECLRSPAKCEIGIARKSLLRAETVDSRQPSGFRTDHARYSHDIRVEGGTFLISGSIV